MQLTLGKTSKLFQVPERTVIRWVQDDDLPAVLVSGDYRFDRTELLEWATLRKVSVPPEIFQEVGGNCISGPSLAEALQRGGVAYSVPGADRRGVLRSVVEGLPVPPAFDRDLWLQLFLKRESLGSTALGEGFAVPHPLHPIVLPVENSLVRLCFLEAPQDFGAADGQRVDTLFVMICPTVHDHLQLLARLGTALKRPPIRILLKERVPANRLIAAVREVEESLSLT